MKKSDVFDRLVPDDSGGLRLRLDHEPHMRQADLARVLGVTRGAVPLWPEVLPELRQLQIESLSRGLLRAGPECDRYRVPHVAPDAPSTGPGALDEQAAA